MGARMKKPLWVLFFFVANIVILGGIKFVFRKNSLNLDRQANLWKFIVTIVCVGILFIFMYHVHTKLFKPKVKRKIQLKDLIFVFLTYIALRFSDYLIYSLWSSMAYGTNRTKLVDFFFKATQTITADKFVFALEALELVCIAPLIEEFLFRGFLNNLLREKVNAFVRMSIVSILFAALHFTYIHNWIQFLDYLIGSIVLFLVYERRRSLFDAILLHSLYNGLLVILFIEIPRRFF
ncbi:lysostaphin resistance A-like protein [Granulicatella adiacens]|uniref:lysostaphin resistance A-like protein n=1 Tax=Granulicatella adiacens TaxID=46124 RepID=UPI004027600D